MSDIDPKLAFYNSCIAVGVVRSVAVIAAAALLLTGYFACCAWQARDLGCITTLAAVWAVTPPIWFWFDYFWLYRRVGDGRAFEQFKHGQQVSIAIWAAVAVTLGALANSDRFKDESRTQARYEGSAR
jgi:uncharacterized membrane-anchored protein